MRSVLLILVVALVAFAYANEEAVPRRRVSANPDELLHQQAPNVDVDQHFVLLNGKDESPFVKVTDEK